MITKVHKSGNSIALRIPKAFADKLQIAADTLVELTLQDGKLVIAPAGRRRYALEELLIGVTPENLHGQVDWGAPVGLEEQ